MPYVKRTVRAGDTIEVKKYFTSRFGKKDKDKRNAKVNVSSEKMQEINEKNAIEKLTWLLNANFKAGDIHMVLTYNKELLPDEETAKDNLRKFMRNLRKAYKIEGSELKYIDTTEYEHTRIHHHLVINKFDTQKIQELWQYGRIHFSIFDNSGDYSKLAAYLVKETSETFRSGKISGKRWNASKNLVKPKIEKEIVSADSWTKSPKAMKGYFIPKTSIEMDVDAFGYPYQKYTMIKIPEKKGIRDGKYRSYNGPLNC